MNIELPFIVPPVSLSAPTSRTWSRIASPVSRVVSPLSPSKQWTSLPGSPIAKSKKFRQRFLAPAPSLSPTRGTRRRPFHATFTTEQRQTTSEAQCPVHSYTSLHRLQPIGAATISKESRKSDARASCPVHAYTDGSSSLKQTAAPFTTAAPRSELVTHGPAVHSYADPVSTLTRAGATPFGKAASARGDLPTHGPAVHAYAGPTSTLSRAGSSAFGKAFARIEPLNHSSAVHAYAAQTSTLRKTSVAFGSTAPRPIDAHTLSRTGLMTATRTRVEQPSSFVPPSSRKPSLSVPKLVEPMAAKRPQSWSMASPINPPLPDDKGDSRATSPNAIEELASAGVITASKRVTLEKLVHQLKEAEHASAGASAVMPSVTTHHRRRQHSARFCELEEPFDVALDEVECA